MPRIDFARMRCPVARAMAILGERWAILVLREAFYGTTRFDAFERNLGIAPNILSARLSTLVRNGLLERVPVRGARHEYRLAAKGRDFFSAYVALKHWSDRWMTGPEGPVVRLLDAATGAEVVAPPLLGAGGAPLGPEDVRVVPGPGAGQGARRRFGGAEPGEAEPGADRRRADTPGGVNPRREQRATANRSPDRTAVRRSEAGSGAPEAGAAPEPPAGRVVAGMEGHRHG
ncbi:helix-turn-helix transcriptional regulator [Roseomonas sp. NAR14]|uniref:Helix-turn-helix transcriptional regulator n=1 Tax=Roseomonas acroporae TaxID=2937791 RepID=A0A9X1Y8N1_9PROT|nr:helix-turn-helix domain-containing protein [Roseomonas acroporae]MCK8785538.1 helix-turn-helix transcriptional regulator [Roseomonas acroporae]